MEPEMRILRCPFTTTALRSYVTAADAAAAATAMTNATATAEAAMDGMRCEEWSGVWGRRTRREKKRKKRPRLSVLFPPPESEASSLFSLTDGT